MAWALDMPQMCMLGACNNNATFLQPVLIENKNIITTKMKVTYALANILIQTESNYYAITFSPS